MSPGGILLSTDMPMHLISHYDAAIASCEEKIESIRRKINIVSLVRLLLFAGLAYTLWSFTHGLSAIGLILAILLAGYIAWRLRRRRRLRRRGDHPG